MCLAFSNTATRCPRVAATRAASNPATPPPTTTTLRGSVVGAYQSGSSVSRPADGSPTQLTIGLRTSRTWHVWLQRMHGRIVVARPVSSLATRSGSAICARVISTPSQTPSIRAVSAWPQSTIEPWRNTGVGATAVVTALQTAMLKPGRLVEIGPSLLGGVDRTAHHDEIVETGSDERCGDLGRHVGRDSGPRSQLVAAQPQPQQRCVRAHGRNHLPGEHEAILPPWIVAVVGQAREELAYQAVLAGVDLDTVAAGVRRDGCGAGEAGDHRVDVVGLHPLRRLPAVDLGNPRWRQQRQLAVRAAALAAGVVERCDHHGVVGVAGVGDLLPAGGTALCQRRSFVRPVAVVHAGTLGHNDAATSRRHAWRSTPCDAE